MGRADPDSSCLISALHSPAGRADALQCGRQGSTWADPILISPLSSSDTPRGLDVMQF